MRAINGPRSTTVAIAAALLVAVALQRPMQAQTVDERRVYVNFNNVTGTLAIDDNPFPALIGVNQNGTLHVTFQAEASTLASYTGAFTGPQGSTLQVAQKV